MNSVGRVAAAVGSLAIAVAGTPGALVAADADDRIRALARAAGQTAPVIRVGFDDAESVRLDSAGRFRLVDPATGDTVWRREFRGEVAVLLEGAPARGPSSVYRVQVGAYSDAARANAERDRLAKRYGVPAVARYVPDRDSWRVRLGEASSRDGLANLLDRLRADGLTGLWIAEEPATIVEGVTLRLVDARTFEKYDTGLTRIVAVPVGKSHVELDGSPYRGVIELRTTPYGTVRAVDWVHFETYLRGVVPAELGPAVWPEIEALKAQAVAARTYAWGHMGQFEEDGFDQCATPRCQVYKGVATEHPLSDRAIAETRGEILVWGDEAINAMFTAVCGGHTEDAGEIFPEERAPYLAGVPCVGETAVLRERAGSIAGRAPVAVHDETGEDVTRAFVLLRAIGVVREDADAMARPMDAETIATWTERFRRAAGLASASAGTAADGAAGDATLARVATHLVDGLGWRERASVLLANEDPAAILREPGAGDEEGTVPPLAGVDKQAVAYLARTGALRPFADGRFGVADVPTRARVVGVLGAAATTYDLFGFRDAVVRRVSEGRLRMSVGKGRVELPLAEDVALFGRAGGVATHVAELRLWPGDRVRYRVSDRGAIDVLELRGPVKGLSDDRSARLHSWDVRRTRRELERAISDRVRIGTLRDLRVVRRGVSGRIVELEVIGTAGSEIVRGFDVRRLLRLRESLAVVEIQREPDGTVRAVTFSGKGWGHGIGLCQVGAYGMAVRGADYREILHHYYTDVELRPLR